MQIRAATPTDARAVAEIHVAAWRAAYRGITPNALLDELSVEKREGGWRSAIERGEPQVLVAAEAAQMIGWVAFGKCRDPDQSPSTGEIWAIYAHPEHWSRGVGRTLWSAARAALLDRGFTRVTLWVLTENERACRFYHRAGFIADQESRKPAEFGGIILDEVRFESILTSRGDG